jgi:hypothetical protein
MGTNYYRIPKSSEIVERHQKMCEKVVRLDLWDTFEISRNFANIQVGEWETCNPWDEFVSDLNIHVGKRSGGWKFLWNFNDNKYYSTKEELLNFIRSGRIVDEYGESMDTEEFIEMALNWDGIIVDEEYFKNNEQAHWVDWKRHVDKIIDGLRVSSSTQFS